MDRAGAALRLGKARIGQWHGGPDYRDEGQTRPDCLELDAVLSLELVLETKREYE